MTLTLRSLLLAPVLFLCFSGTSQNYVGLHKDEIKQRVKQELPGFAFTKEVFNNERSFIKFENAFEEQTLIFMLNANGYCTSVSRMYNTWLFNRIRDELITKYGKSRSMKWEEVKDSKKYEIELVKGQWFITVVTRPKK